MKMNKPKLIRITTVPSSLKILLKGQLHFMSQNGFEVLGVSSDGMDLDEVRENESVEVQAIEMTRTISPLKDLKSLWSFYKLCKKEKPQIVHSHTPKAGIIGMLGAKLAGVPYRLHTVAGLPLMEAIGTKRKVLDMVEKLTYRCATNVYPNSKGLYDFILNNKFTSSEKLKVIANGSSNGINTSFFNPLEITDAQISKTLSDCNISSEDFIFIFVGRLVGDKGVNELIKAFSSIGREDVKLLLVGAQEPELDPLLPETLNTINTNPNIISVGFQKDVRPFFSIAHCLVFPSYREGFPNVVMQAGSMMLPAIVSDINGCNEIIVNGENGLIIPVKDSESIENSMKELLANPDLLSKMINNSRKMIQERYEHTIIWHSLLNEYKEIQK